MEAGWHKKPRKTSDAKGSYPYADARVPFIAIIGEPIDIEGNGMNWSNRVEDKLSLVRMAETNEDVTILSVWPGKGRTDVFVVDDLDEAARALDAA